MYADYNGEIPEWIEATKRWLIRAAEWTYNAEKSVENWVDNNVIQPAFKFVSDIDEDIKNFNIHNESEDAVFSSNYFSSYKGSFVLKTPFDASFSYGIIGLSHCQQTTEVLNHEYGHTVQLKNKGIADYTVSVAVPSVTINILDRMDKLKYDYYGAPWEAEADRFGGVNRTARKTPWPEGSYRSYFDLINMFFD